MAFLGFPIPSRIPEQYGYSESAWMGPGRMRWSGQSFKEAGCYGLAGYAWNYSRCYATFIEADPGPSKKPRGGDAKTRLSKDGTWAEKGNEIHFGYKLHPCVIG